MQTSLERISQSRKSYPFDATLFCSFPCHQYLCCATKVAEQSNTIAIVEILVILLSSVHFRSHTIPFRNVCVTFVTVSLHTIRKSHSQRKLYSFCFRFAPKRHRIATHEITYIITHHSRIAEPLILNATYDNRNKPLVRV